MSLIYSVLKPLLRAAKPKRAAMTRNDWMIQAKKIQSNFSLVLPEISGYEIQEVINEGRQCVIISRPENHHQKAVVYYAGGGYIRYQLPNRKSIRHYIEETGMDMWIPLYPLFPDNTMFDAVKFGYALHQEMHAIYSAENIAWLGFSAGANLIMGLGRYLVHKNYELPMPNIIISVSGCNLHISEESRERMKQLEQKDVIFPPNQIELFKPIFDPDGTLPHYITGCASKDDYTGFPRIVLLYGSDEIFSAEALEYEKAFRRCGVKDYRIHIEPNAFHAYPAFTFTPEGKKGENQIIKYLNHERSHYYDK